MAKKELTEEEKKRYEELTGETLDPPPVRHNNQPYLEYEKLLMDLPASELEEVEKIESVGEITGDTNNYVLTTLPLTPEMMRQYFKDKTIIFLADYENSSIKGDTFLTYITNIGIPIEPYFTKDISYQAFSELMGAFFIQKTMVKSQTLTSFAAAILLTHIGLSEQNIPFKSVTPWSHITQFAEDYLYELNKWEEFIDSTEVFKFIHQEILADTILPHDRYPTVDDSDYISPNVANLYLSQEFIVSYEAHDRERKPAKFFKQQATRAMFDGQYLIEYLNQPYNPVSIIADAVINGVLSTRCFDNIDAFTNPKTVKEPIHLANIVNNAYKEPKPIPYPPPIKEPKE